MKRAIPTLIFVLVLSGLALAETMTAQKALDLWASAIGGKEKLAQVNNVYSRGTAETGGLKGPVEDWITSSGKHRSHVQFGNVFSNLTVFDASQGKGWILDQNGKVRALEGTEIQDEITADYLATSSFLFPSRMPGVVEFAGEDESGKLLKLKLKPEGGREVTMYLDKTTGLPVRQEQPQQERTQTTTFSDWRDVDGLKLAFQFRQSTGDPKYDAVITLEEVKTNVSLEDALFAKPQEAEPDFKFASGHSATGIPFELNSNHIYVNVSVNGSRPLSFIFDTGAAFPVLNKKCVKELGLKTEGAMEGRGAGEGTMEVTLISDMSYKLPGVEMFRQKAGAIPLETIEGYDGHRIDGVIGYDFISRFVVEIDYDKQVINLYDPHEYNYTGHGEIVPISLDGNIPAIKAGVVLPGVSPAPGKFTVDTGARNALVLNKPFHEGHNMLASVPHRLDASWGMGVGGQSKETIGRVGQFQVGNLTFENPLTNFSFDAKGAFADPDLAGNIGGEILRRFTVILDYPNSRMILEKNRHFDDPFDFDMSGTLLVAEGDDLRSFKVLKVVPGSPAAEAKMQDGDALEAIDGKPAKDFTLEQIRSMFKVEGKTHALTLSRNGEKVTVSLKLRKLI